MYGVCKWWYINGQIKYEFYCISGKEDGKSFHEDGRLLYEKTYETGKKHGIFKEWYENGKLKCEQYYVNGRKHGICKEWFDNGKLKCEHYYVNGIKHGIWTRCINLFFINR